MTALDALRVCYPRQEVVVVSHGAVIQAICAHITGVWTELAVPPNCGFVTIDCEADGWAAPILSGDWERLVHSP